MIINFKSQILEELIRNNENDDQIEAFEVRGTGRIHDYNLPDVRNINPSFCNIPLKWKDFSNLLDYDTDASYGSVDCHAVTVWTAKFVYFVQDNDGAHYIDCVRRNP